MVFLVGGFLVGVGTVGAGCVWGFGHLLFFEVPSPCFQWRDAAREGEPIEGDTPIFGQSHLPVREYVVDVTGEGRYSCRLDVSRPNQPVLHAEAPMGERPVCMLHLTPRPGETWHIRAEVTGEGTARASIRTPPDLPSFRFVWVGMALAAVLALTGAVLMTRRVRQT